MPELPEVEIVARALRSRLDGLTVEKVEVFSPAMRTSLTPLLSAGLEGRKIIEVARRGRYITIELSGGKYLLMHLGMSGVLRVEPPTVPKRKHEHVFFYLSDKSLLRFECTRRFSLCEAYDGYPEKLAELGVEPLTSEFTGEYFYKESRRHTGSVKTFLMDNAVQVGIGNIYAAETLFAAGVSPLRPACRITRGEAEKIVAAAKRILTASIEVGGSSIHDYRHIDGTEGRFSQRLLIYGHAGEACPVCGTVIELVRLGGRSSCFCPKCQK